MQIVAKPRAFDAPQLIAGIAPGQTVEQIVAAVYERAGVPVEWARDVLVQINGHMVPRSQWRNVRPKDGTNIVVTTSLHGGGGNKNLLNLVFSIVVVVAAPYLAPAIVGAGASKFATTLATAFIAVAGTALVNALFPIRLPSLTGDTRRDSPTYSIGGARNQAIPFGTVPVVLGTHKHTPPLAAASYTELLGEDEYLRMLVVWGYGPLSIGDLHIGNTPITAYADVEVETREGYAADDPVTLFPGIVRQEQVGVVLREADSWTTRTTEIDTDEITFDVVFPRGLTRFNDKGDRVEVSVTYAYEYRPVGGAWSTEVQETVARKTTSPVRLGVRLDGLARGQYEVRLRRVTADSTNDRTVDELVWANLRSFTNEQPVQFRQPVALTALRIRATEQLSGVIDTLNAIVTSLVPVWNGTAWGTTPTASNNPAALFRHVLLGPANDRPRTGAQIDDETLGAWYDFCETNGYTFNMVRDFQASVWDTLADIASAGRAAPTLIDGKWSVIVDTPDKPVRQHFTPRNSWGFESSKALPIQPHAWRVRFVNEERDYQQDERIVYDDGYTAANATRFEGIEFPGITRPDLVWKFGRYHIAQARLRPEEYSFSADFEHLACQRGDLILVSHDVTLWGSGTGRVKALQTSGTDTTGVIVDELFAVESLKHYSMRFRLADGESLLAAVSADAGQQDTFTLTTPVATAGGPQVGDLVMFGEAGVESRQLLVKTIERGDEFTARITCVDEAPEIYSADTGAIPAFDSMVTELFDVTRFPPSQPGILRIESGTAALLRTNNGFLPRILVSLVRPQGQIPLREYQVRYRETNGGEWTTVSSPVEQSTVALLPVVTGETYDIQARTVSAYGVPSAWVVASSETVQGEDEPPPDVTGFGVNVVGDTAHLSWSNVLDVDLSHYRIKWSPEKQGATWNTAVDVAPVVSGVSVSLPAQIGTYLIKAVDYAGNESETASAAITNVAKLTGLNIVEEIVKASPTWPGTKEDTVYDTGVAGVVLETDLSGNLYALGYYYVDQVIDLQDVFTTRVTGSLDAYGADLGADLYDLANLYETTNLYGVQDGTFRAGIEMSTTDDDPTGTPTWSDWRRLVVGDYSARAYRFRIRLEGDGGSVTPVLQGARMEVDMEDRIIRFSADIPIAGARVAFDPPFFAFPDDRGLGISVFDGQEGDRYTITNLGPSGFDIAFTNSGSAVARRISGVAQSYGELAA